MRLTEAGVTQRRTKHGEPRAFGTERALVDAYRANVGEPKFLIADLDRVVGEMQTIACTNDEDGSQPS